MRETGMPKHRVTAKASAPMQASPQEIHGVRRSGAHTAFSMFRNKRPLEDISTNTWPDLTLPCDRAPPQTGDPFSVPLMSQTPASSQQGLPTPQALQEGCQDIPLTGIHGRAEESQ